jgi:hypothetical protein
VKARIALQIYNRGSVPNMLAKLESGRSIDAVITWDADELEGFTADLSECAGNDRSPG